MGVGYKMMKISRWEASILLIAALFLAFTAGWFLKGNSGGEPFRVETQRKLDPSTVVTLLPAPAGVEKVNINTADAAALSRLPGIGEKRAADVIADREANGPFRFPEDITRVKGIGEETLKQFVDRITVEDDE